MNAALLVRLWFVASLGALLSSCAAVEPATGVAAHYPQSRAAPQRVLPTRPARGPILVQLFPLSQGTAKFPTAPNGLTTNGGKHRQI